jgi:hypothetical protein
MATVEERHTALDKATSQLRNLAALDPKALARTSDLSPDINFKDAVPHFEEMLDLCKQLQQRDLSRLTMPQLNVIAQACARLETLIKQVQDSALR